MADYVMSDEDFTALWETVVGAAGGESEEGQIAVAWVVMNRVKHPRRWPNTIYAVCHEPGQFGAFNGSIDLEARKEELAGLKIKKLLSDDFFKRHPDPTKGCNHFCPVWDKEGMERAELGSNHVQIGNHYFYKL